MITSNIGRAALLGLIPVAAALNILNIGILLVVAFLVGVLRVFFEIAYQSFLPGIVEREKLVDANSRLEASRSVSSVAGPGVAGVLIQIISAPFAIAVDMASFILSTAFLGKVKHQEIIEERSDRPSVVSQIREGLEIVLRDPKLRSIAGASGTANFFEFAVQAIFILYTVEVLRVQPEELGIILSLGAIGALAGALTAGRLADRIGIGPAIMTSLTLGAIIWGPLIYLATPTTAAPLLITAWFFGELSFVSWNINQSSFRQAICSSKLQGRMNATLRFIAAGTVPLGSLTGGLMGQMLGLRTAIGIAAIGLMFAPLWFLFSPMRNLKRVSGSDQIGRLTVQSMEPKASRG